MGIFEWAVQVWLGYWTAIGGFFAGIGNFFVQFGLDFWKIFIEANGWLSLLKGLGNTLLISLGAVHLGVVLGVLVAMVRSTYDKNREVYRLQGGFKARLFRFLNGICHVYLTVVRGTPVMVQLLLMYLVILVNVRSATVVAIIAFGINSGAYVAEIIRSGIMAVDHGQFEAGRSLGFSYMQTMFYVVIPQAFKKVLPTLCSEFIVLLKETSVAGYVGVTDLNKAGEILRTNTYNIYMPLLLVAGIYLGVVVLLTFLVGKLEKRLRKNER